MLSQSWHKIYDTHFYFENNKFKIKVPIKEPTQNKYNVKFNAFIKLINKKTHHLNRQRLMIITGIKTMCLIRRIGDDKN